MVGTPNVEEDNQGMSNVIAKAFQEFIAHMMATHSSAASSSTPRAMSLDKGSLFDKFLKGDPLELSDPNDSSMAELWLNKIEKIFAILGCSSEEKVKFAEYKLQGAVENWWRMIKRQYEGRENELTWDLFLEVFNDKYYPATIRRKKQMEFHSLEQGNMSVVDYETKFVELSRFAPNQVAREEDKIFMFQKGLRADILSKVQMMEPKTYGDCIKKATIAEEGLENEKPRQQGTKRDRDQSLRGPELSRQQPCPRCNRFHSYGVRCNGTPHTCFNCGKTGHMQHECKTSSQTTQQDPKFNARGGNYNEGQKPREQGKVFSVMGTQEAPQDHLPFP